MKSKDTADVGLEGVRTMLRKRIPVRTALALVIVMAGAALACYPLWTDAECAISQQIMRAEGAVAGQAPQAAGGTALPSGAVARLLIPKCGIDAFVVEGTTPTALNKGPGHYEETPLPGEKGNSGIASHRTMYGAVFRHIDRLKKGDRFRTYTRTRTTQWVVESVRPVDPTNISVVAQTDATKLTLTTCHPVGSARQRLVVTAVPAQ